MNNWLNCNKCGVLRSEYNTTEYFCGSCSHVFCSACSNNLKNCPIDRCTYKGIPINASMPQKLRSYFEDPNKFIIAWQKAFRFQSEQRSLCEPMEFTRNMKKLRQLKDEIKLFDKTKKVIDETNEKERKRNNKIKTYLKYCHEKRINRSVATSASSTSYASFDFSSAHAESGVDMQFDEFDCSI